MELRKIINSLAFTIITLSAVSQEVLINLSSYPMPEQNNQKRLNGKSKGVLALPFFDDFARLTTIPTTELWERSSVTTNQSYAINPPTIGVATFDAINCKGELYPMLTTTAQMADTLTSLPINLTGCSDVFLSFCYQPKGLGYEPSSEDSLVLELWDNNQTRWISAWSSSVNFEGKKITQKDILKAKYKTIQSDTLNKTFFNAIISVNEAGFLTSNFKFRFINYASISGNTQVPGLRSNSDHWHLDMVYLNKDRYEGDTIYNDISFSKPIMNLMANYTSIPWSHYSSASQSEFAVPNKFVIDYHNLGSTTWNISRRFKVVDLSGSQSEYSFSGGAENIYSHQKFNYTRLFDYNFTSAWQDSAKYLLQSYLITDIFEETKHLRYNDTISRTFVLDNYYALDDGTAESGYGLLGEGTEDGMVAVKFHNYSTDDLCGVMIYFNKTWDNANQVTFKFTIWSNNNGKPGEIIYQQNSTLPLFTDALNKFTVYRITPTNIPAGDFFIGWTQTNQDMLNVGFDMNTNNRSRIFYNISGNWVNTKFEGSLMIRPIFGKMHQIPTNVTPNPTNQNISIYPNPAKDNISIKVDNDTEIATIQIFSSVGNVVLSQNYYNQESINIQNIPTGLYIVKVCPRKGKCITSKLLIVR